MKLFTLVVFSVFTFAVLSAFQETPESPCESKTLKTKSRKTLEPYKYDSAKLTKIIYRKKEFLREIEVPLFFGEKYRCIFNTETLNKGVVINVYNKDKDSRNRKLLFTTKDAPATQTEYIWEHGHSTKIFVDYSIPAGDSTSTSGCVLFMLGYK
jgi:hypothetical protein